MASIASSLEKSVAAKSRGGLSGWANAGPALYNTMNANVTGAQRYSGRLALTDAKSGKSNLTAKAARTISGNPRALARLGSAAITRFGGNPNTGWGQG